MGASDAHWLLEAFSDVFEGLDRHRTSGRTLLRPHIGLLHFLPMPPGERSMWGVVTRYPDQREPFYAVFEVDGESDPSLPQEAHYTAVRRLEAHYLGSASPVLLGLVNSLPDAAKADVGPLAVTDFRAISLRIPPNPFEGDVWKMRYQHRAIPSSVFELEHRFCEVIEASIYSFPTDRKVPNSL